jgi:hypothetical protein
MSRPKAALGLLVLVLALAGCARIPVEVLHAYGSSFEQARAVSADLIDDHAHAITVEAERSRAQANPETEDGHFPDAFDPQEALRAASGEEVPAIAERRRALEVIAAWNEVLLGLAEGRSVAEVGARTRAFGDRVQELLAIAGVAVQPFAGPVIGGLEAVLGLVEEARTRAEFRRVVQEGHEPVDTLLGALIDDTPHLYEARKNVQGFLILDAEEDMGSLRAAMQTLAARHRAPTSPELIAGHERIEREMRATFAAIVPGPLPELRLETSPDGVPYDRDALEALDGLRQQMAGAGARRSAAVADINAYHESLTAHVRLLDEARRGLAALRRAVLAPPDRAAAALEIASSAALLRGHARRIRDLRRAGGG